MAPVFVVLCMVPVALQLIGLLIDEVWCHRTRGLPHWERIGHPLDTLTVAVCLGWLIATTPAAPLALPIYLVLALFSTVFITKDHAVHAVMCGRFERSIHTVLFVLHPLVLTAFGVLWWYGHAGLLFGQLSITIAVMAYQIIYWQFEGAERDALDAIPRAVNNDWYADLGARWYTATDTPIALVRAEARHRNPLIADEIAKAFGPLPCRVLDLGCGAGFLSNYLAEHGHTVTGIDMTAESLAVAQAHDQTRSVHYQLADAGALPFERGAFDVVCATDLLQRVDDPDRVIAEASRVLAPGGLFVFHTYNRTWQSNAFLIKAVEWFMRNVPVDLHVLRMFLTPAELQTMCHKHRLESLELRGTRPRFGWAAWRTLLTGRIGDDFAFIATPSTKLGMLGMARRRGTPLKVGAAQGPAHGTPPIGAPIPQLCDGSRDAEAVLAHEVRTGPVRDLGPRAG